MLALKIHSKEDKAKVEDLRVLMEHHEYRLCSSSTASLFKIIWWLPIESKFVLEVKHQSLKMTHRRAFDTLEKAVEIYNDGASSI